MYAKACLLATNRQQLVDAFVLIFSVALEFKLTYVDSVHTYELMSRTDKANLTIILPYRTPAHWILFIIAPTETYAFGTYKQQRDVTKLSTQHKLGKLKSYTKISVKGSIPVIMVTIIECVLQRYVKEKPVKLPKFQPQFIERQGERYRRSLNRSLEIQTPMLEDMTESDLSTVLS